MEKKRSLLSWVLEFAGRKKSYFGGSVVLAILGVAASFITYLIMADIVEKLICGNKDWDYYLRQHHTKPSGGLCAVLPIYKRRAAISDSSLFCIAGYPSF